MVNSVVGNYDLHFSRLMNILSVGRNRSTSVCEDARCEQRDLSGNSVKNLQVCLYTGKQAMLGKFEWWEPDKSRGLCPVLRAAEGEVPLVDSPGT